MNLTVRNPATTLGDIVTHMPGAAAAFERLGLDYCCGGKRSLADACEEAGLDLNDVLQAIVEASSSHDQADTRDWSQATMTDLADHIEQTHHAFVRDALQRLGNLLPRVVQVHGPNRPELRELAEVYHRFAADMIDHMTREERVLFPWLRRLEDRPERRNGPPWSVRGPIDCMEHDHDEAGNALRRMRELTDGFSPPQGACMTYRAMLELLAALEADTHVHVHKENNILFPAGIRAEQRAMSAN